LLLWQLSLSFFASWVMWVIQAALWSHHKVVYTATHCNGTQGSFWYGVTLIAIFHHHIGFDSVCRCGTLSCSRCIHCLWRQHGAIQVLLVPWIRRN
jgi:hypothetical protein